MPCVPLLAVDRTVPENARAHWKKRSERWLRFRPCRSVRAGGGGSAKDGVPVLSGERPGRVLKGPARPHCLGPR